MSVRIPENRSVEDYIRLDLTGNVKGNLKTCSNYGKEIIPSIKIKS